MTDKKEIQIQAINDTSDKHMINHKQLFNLPMRLLIIGKSQLSGKTTLLVNLIAQNWGYKDLFKPDNIFIISPSVKTEKLDKLVKYLEIPKDNLFDDYDETRIDVLYDTLKEEHESTEDKEHKLLIFDDVAFTGKMKSDAKKVNNVMDKLFCNSRHQLISVIVLAQKYTQVSTCMRENCTGIIIFESSNKQVELLEEEHNTVTTKKEFMEQFKKATAEKHSFFTINYNYPSKERFRKDLTQIIDFDKT